MSDTPTPRMKVDIPFTAEETTMVKQFAKATGRKPGPWARALMLQAIAAETSRGVGSLLPQHQDAYQ